MQRVSTLALAAFIASPALAADKAAPYIPGISDPVAYKWSGPYIGAHLGYGWANNDVDLSHSTGAIFYNDPFVPSSGSLDGGDGVLGGLQVGIDKQFDRFVVGLVGDFTWGDMSADATATTPLGSQWKITSDLDVMGTARVKAGYLVSPALLLYATGGVAWAKFDVKQATTFVDKDGNFLDDGGRTSGSFDHVGYTIGGGAEWALGGGWSVSGEYLYADFGEQDYQLKGTTKPNGGAPYVETFAQDVDMHILRAGVNYRF